MSHSYVCCHVHYIFSTKDRQRLITPEVRERLFAFMGGVARENGMKALIISGTDNHAHALVGLPATIDIAKGVQLIKGGSSKWASETFPSLRGFEWQEGYGAFGVSASLIARVMQYIKNQEEHHRARTFEEEFVAMLEKCGIEYDPRYVFG